MNSSVGSLQNINTAKSVNFKSRMVRVQSCAASLSCLGIHTVHPSKVLLRTHDLVDQYFMMLAFLSEVIEGWVNRFFD